MSEKSKMIFFSFFPCSESLATSNNRSDLIT
jgi:hypothetical protein